MNITAEYDFSNLTKKVSGLTGALLGSGASPGELQQVLSVETGQLAGRIGDAIGPKTQAAAMRKVDKEMKQYVTVLPAYSNLNSDQQFSTTADFTWLVASPGSLTGINDEDNQTDADGEEALAMFRGSQKAGPRGNKYIKLGKRGHQTIQRLNRTRISKSAYNYIRATIRNKTGELRAAFYRVAIQYAPKRRVPGWILPKVEQVISSGKSSISEGGRGTADAFIEFAVRAPGVTSNANIAAKIQGAVAATTEAVSAKLKKILAGYRYNWETGQVFRAKPADFEDN